MSDAIVTKTAGIHFAGRRRDGAIVLESDDLQHAYTLSGTELTHILETNWDYAKKQEELTEKPATAKWPWPLFVLVFMTAVCAFISIGVCVAAQTAAAKAEQSMKVTAQLAKICQELHKGKEKR